MSGDVIREILDIPDRLLQAIHRAPLIPADQIDRYVRQGGTLDGPRSRRIGGELSKREIEVLTAISHGLGPSEAAEVLGLSHWTIESHLRRIRPVLKAKNNLHAVARALRMGLID